MSSVSLIGKNLGEIEDEIAYDSLDELAAICSTETWAPGLFVERKRLIKNVSRIELLALDVDGGCSLQDAKTAFEGFSHIIATTRSHQKEKNGVTCDRFRVILFLNEPVFNDTDFKATWNRAFRLWPFIDAACKDSSRFFYPSPNIYSINRTGRAFDISISVPEIQKARTEVEVGTRPKGELWKSTLEFLLQGAPAGHRHNALVQAVGNMREQGYSEPETLEALTKMVDSGGDWTQDHLSRIDLATVSRMYAREMKYGYIPRVNENNLAAIIVNASELLEETFSYLADKDKVKGEPTGIAGLDDLLGGGFRTGELSVLMAQAKTGKNTLYHYMIYKHLERGLPYGYASRELNPATEVVPNLLSIAMGLNTWNADLTEAFKKQARGVMSNWNLYFAPGYGHFDTEQLETWFRRLKDVGVNHFLFDHFHYALQSEDHESTTTLIKKLKSLTKELDIHLSLIVQPRSLREGEQLGLGTLRGGAAIGQALDNLLILERVRGEQNVSKLTLEVARHKLAKLGHLFLKYDTNTTSFDEVSKELISEAPLVPRGITNSKYGKPFPRLGD